MTDLLTKVKAALEGATPGPWRPGVSTFFAGLYGPACMRVYTDHPPTEFELTGDNLAHNANLVALAPDMARAMIAAEQTAGNPDWVAARIREFDGNHDKGAGAIGEYVATAFRAAMEGRTDDRP